MVEGLEKVDDLYLSILALLPRDHKKVNEAFARRVKKLATGILEIYYLVVIHNGDINNSLVL